MTDEQKTLETKDTQFTAEELKIIKQLEESQASDYKLQREEIKLKGLKYKWFLDHLYDIDPIKGLMWKDYDQISIQRKTVFNLVKQIGTNLLRGKSVMSVSLPIIIMEPQSMLQRIAWSYGYLPAYAEKIVREKEPLEKLKLYLAFSIAALYGNLQQKKPLNPVWGETYQGYLGSSKNMIYCEQISHHPPVAHITIESPYFLLNATHHIEAATYPNSILITGEGKHVITFKDEQQTTFELKERPEGHVGGIAIGQRTLSYDGCMLIEDTKNKLYAQARFNPEKQGMLERLFNKTKPTRADFFKGLITKNKELLKDMSRKVFYSKDMISYFEGEWLEYIIIDGEYYWELGKKLPVEVYGIAEPLPSDTMLRGDVGLLLKGDLETAQKEKEKLEDEQRKDRKLRADYIKTVKK